MIMDVCKTKKIIITRLKTDAGQCNVTLYVTINKNVNTNNY